MRLKKFQLTSVNGVCALGGLSGKHDTVSTVKDGVGDVTDLSARGTVVDNHGLEHLSSADAGLAGDVALGDHHLLGHEHLAGGDLDTEITTGDHDTVRLLENLVKVEDTLVVLDLGDNLNVGSLLAQNFTDGADVATAANERCENNVHVLLNTEKQILAVLLGDGGQVDVGQRKVDTLARRERAVVHAADLDHVVGFDGDDFERLRAAKKFAQQKLKVTNGSLKKKKKKKNL